MTTRESVRGWFCRMSEYPNPYSQGHDWWGPSQVCPKCGAPVQWFIRASRGIHRPRRLEGDSPLPHACPAERPSSRVLQRCFCGRSVYRDPETDLRYEDVRGADPHTCNPKEIASENAWWESRFGQRAEVLTPEVRIVTGKAVLEL